MTTKKTEAELAQEARDARIEERGEAAAKQLSNKDRREAIKVFEANWDDLDAMDQTVVLVWISEGRTKPLAEYDALPLVELEEILLGNE